MAEGKPYIELEPRPLAHVRSPPSAWPLSTRPGLPNPRAHNLPPTRCRHPPRQGLSPHPPLAGLTPPEGKEVNYHRDTRHGGRRGQEMIPSSTPRGIPKKLEPRTQDHLLNECTVVPPKERAPSVASGLAPRASPLQRTDGAARKRCDELCGQT